MDKLLLTLLVALTAAPVQAQPASASTLEGMLSPGMTAWITDSSGREEKTRIVGVSDGIVTASAGDEVREFRTANVTRVRVRRNDSLLNGALIGAGVAIGSGLFMCNLTEPWRNCRDDVGPMVRIGAFGAGLGLAVDAFIRGRHTIYENQRTGLRLKAAPLIAPGLTGTQVSLTF